MQKLFLVWGLYTVALVILIIMPYKDREKQLAYMRKFQNDRKLLAEKQKKKEELENSKIKPEK